MTRPLPWTEIAAAIGSPRFEVIREALKQAGTDDLDRDAFLHSEPVGLLLREMMPSEAPAELVTAYAALIHMLYVTWARDWPIVPVTADQLREALSRTTPHSPRPIPAVCYVQLPERLVWAEPAAGEAHEPLDGIFLVAGPRRADAVAVLGFRTGRDGFTTMEGAIELPAPAPPAREDGAPAFASALPAGDRKGLLSVVDAHELVSLALASLDAVS